jgi:hypothetical protein
MCARIGRAVVVADGRVTLKFLCRGSSEDTLPGARVKRGQAEWDADPVDQQPADKGGGRPGEEAHLVSVREKAHIRDVHERQRCAVRDLDVEVRVNHKHILGNTNDCDLIHPRRVWQASRERGACHRRMHKRGQAETHKRAHIYIPLSLSLTHTHTDRQRQTDRHTETHRHTDTHTHTHTHTQQHCSPERLIDSPVGAAAQGM